MAAALRSAALWCNGGAWPGTVAQWRGEVRLRGAKALSGWAMRGHCTVLLGSGVAPAVLGCGFASFCLALRGPGAALCGKVKHWHCYVERGEATAEHSIAFYRTGTAEFCGGEVVLCDATRRDGVAAHGFDH